MWKLDVPNADLHKIQRPTTKFLALEAMRGVAALAVGIAHSNEVLLSSPGLGNPGFAVDFFFMLSGFVLAHAYAPKLDRRGYVAAYLSRRAIRLYPLIAVGAVLGFVPWFVHGLNPMYLMRLLGQGILLLPEPWSSPIDEGIFPLNPPAWSLFFEMVASVLFGFGIWRSKLLAVSVLLGSVAMLLAIAAGRSAGGWAFGDLGWGFVRVFYGFGAGVALYRYRRNLPVPGLPLPLLLAGLFLFLMIPIASKTLIGLTLYAVFPFLILSGARTQSQFRRFSYWSGQLSYPFYILHWPLYYWILGAVMLADVHMPRIVVAASGLACAIIGSFVVLTFVDRPIRAWLTTVRRTTNDI